jgi:hypothetical protein
MVSAAAEPSAVVEREAAFILCVFETEEGTNNQTKLCETFIQSFIPHDIDIHPVSQLGTSNLAG